MARLSIFIAAFGLIGFLSAAQAQAFNPPEGLCALVPTLPICTQLSGGKIETKNSQGKSLVMERRSQKNAFGERSFLLYVPTTKAKKMPIVVMLHGCLQNAQQFAEGTGLNDAAETMGVIAIYPEQTNANNIMSCWNWFKPENLARDGELSIIADMAKAITKEFSADSSKVFVAGLSAGGAMASNLMACYSDVFSGGLVHSGLEYNAAETEMEAHQVIRSTSGRDLEETATKAVKCSPTRKTALRVMAVHGSSDPFVNPKNSEQVMVQFYNVNDLIDNGKLDDSLKLKQVDRVIVQKTGYKGEVNEYFLGSKSVLEFINVPQMGHGWSGGQGSQYMESRGPNVTEEMLRFFLQ